MSTGPEPEHDDERDDWAEESDEHERDDQWWQDQRPPHWE